MNNANHKIIFEGAELSGKSYIMSQIYNYLEPKYNSGGMTMDGCHWFNCDVGIFGTKYGKLTLEKYTELIEGMEGANIILEKFHLTEKVYQSLYNRLDFDYSYIEERLAKLDAKLVLLTFDEDEKLLEKRLQDRLNLYPHYKKIAQAPKKYIEQQRLYKELIKESKLDYIVVDSSVLPNQATINKILDFLGEK